VKRAITEEADNFKEKNFFQDNELTIYTQNFDSDYRKISAADHPYPIYCWDGQMKIIRKISSSRGSRNLWFLTSDFFRNENGDILCKGDILKLWYRKNDQGKYCHKLYNNSLQALELYKSSQYIPLSGLHFANDFVYRHKNDSCDISGWLFEWILS
jgi:hypothetical protein